MFAIRNINVPDVRGTSFQRKRLIGARVHVRASFSTGSCSDSQLNRKFASSHLRKQHVRAACFLRVVGKTAKTQRAAGGGGLRQAKCPTYRSIPLESEAGWRSFQVSLGERASANASQIRTTSVTLERGIKVRERERERSRFQIALQ